MRYRFFRTSKKMAAVITTAACLSLCLLQQPLIAESGTDPGIIAIVEIGDSGESSGGVGADAVSLSYEKLYEEIGRIVEERNSTDSDSVKTAGSELTLVSEYYNLFNGIAVRVPKTAVGAIAKIDGVSNVYIGNSYVLEAEGNADGSDMETVNSLTGASECDFTGKGQAIAVLDASLFTDHEVFGQDPDEVKLSEEYIEDIKSDLRTGKDGSYISSKIPFVYDYADRDSDVSPSGKGSLADRGTHISAAIVGNSGDFKGPASDAQLVFCKILSDGKEAASEADILSALDDCYAMDIDEVNLSFSTAAVSFGSEASSALWSDILNKFADKGVIVNAAAGKSSADRSEMPSDFPDNGNISAPASYPKTLAVADINIENEGESRSSNSLDGGGAWGPTPELGLKPDIAAPCNILSASADSEDSYAVIANDFDSVACMTGLTAKLREYIEEDAEGYFEGLSEREKRERISELLMSTAHPQINPASDSYYSPRRQGAGCADIKAASTTAVYATVEGAEYEELVKAELGDNPRRNGEFAFSIILHNMSEEDISYEPLTAVLSEEVEEGCFTGNDFELTDKGFAEVTYSGDAYEDGKILVPANEEASFTVNIRLDDSFEEWLEDAAQNGAYVEGYAMLKNDDGGAELSIPFMGFYGNWGKINPVFDKRIDLDEGTILQGESYINPSTGYVLGINPLATFTEDEDYDIDDIELNFDNIIISDSTADYAPNALLPQSSILRSAKALTYEYRSADGSLVEYYSEDYVRKSGYTEDGEYNYAEDNMTAYPLFDGLQKGMKEGEYSLKKTLLTAGPSSEKYEESIDFYYDKTSPTFGELSYSGSGEDCTVSFRAEDNKALAGVTLSDPDTDEIFYAKFAEAGSTEEDFSINISEATEFWKSQNADYDLPLQVMLTVWDYGLNYKRKYLNFAAAYQETNTKYGLDTYEVSGVAGLYVSSYAHVPYFGKSRVTNSADIGLTLEYENIVLDSSEIKVKTEQTGNYDGTSSYLTVYLAGVKPSKTRSSSEKAAIKKEIKLLMKELKEIPIAEIEVYPRMIKDSDRISRMKEAKEEGAVYYICSSKAEEVKHLKVVVITHKAGGGKKKTVLKLKEDVDYYTLKGKIYFDGYQVQGKVTI